MSINENLKEARAKVKITKPIPKNMSKGDKLRHDAKNHLEMSQSTTRSGLGNMNQNKIGHSHGFLKSTMAANRADAKDNKVSKPKKGVMKEPEKGKKPERITTPGKPGDSGPGGAHPGKNPPKKEESLIKKVFKRATPKVYQERRDSIKKAFTRQTPEVYQQRRDNIKEGAKKLYDSVVKKDSDSKEKKRQKEMRKRQSSDSNNP